MDKHLFVFFFPSGFNECELHIFGFGEKMFPFRPTEPCNGFFSKRKKASSELLFATRPHLDLTTAS